MDYKEFLKKDYYSQLKLIFTFGDYIAQRHYLGQRVLLFRLDNILVEVYYQPIGIRILNLVVISLEDALKLYWQSVDLEYCDL